MTVASLFRVIEAYQPTLLIDEADTFLNDNFEFAGIVNKGFERGGVVIRTESVGDEFKPRAYKVYGPKAIAGISLERCLQEATLSRGIEIPMEKKTRDAKVERMRTASPAVFKSLRSRLSRFAEDHREILAKGWDQLPEELSDRQQDCWEPLLAIANRLGEHAYGKAWKAALVLSKNAARSKSAGNSLLADIREILQNYKDPKISSFDLVERLTSGDDMEWKIYNNGRPLNQRQLSRFLAAYRIETKTVRINGRTPKGFEVRDFNDAFERYLPPRSSDAVESEPEVSPPKNVSPSSFN